jgi:hypothetical protein
MKQELLFSTSLKAKLEKLSQNSAVARYLLSPELISEASPHHCTIRDNESMVSYMPKGKAQEYNPDGGWSRTGRQTMKIGRWVRQMLKPECIGAVGMFLYGCEARTKVTDKNIEDFVNQLQMQFEGDLPYTFMLVSGRDIAEYYNYRNYGQTGGTLWNSCMRGADAETFDIYVKNPEVCRMLCLIEKATGKLIARALVWTTEDGKTFMDRIYYVNDKICKLMIDYAMERGWLFKYSQSSDCYEQVTEDYENVQEKVKLMVKMQKTNMAYFPYMDTFRYAFVNNKGEGFLANYCANVKVNRYTQKQHGQWDKINVEQCAFSGECYWDNSAGGFRVIKYGRLAGQKVWNVYVINTSLRGYVLKEDCVCDHFTGNYIHKDDSAVDYRGRSFSKVDLRKFKDKIVSRKDRDILFADDFYSYANGNYGRIGMREYHEMQDNPDFCILRDEVLIDARGCYVLPQHAIVFCGNVYHYNDRYMKDLRKKDAKLRSKVRKLKKQLRQNPFAPITATEHKEDEGITEYENNNDEMEYDEVEERELPF